MALTTDQQRNNMSHLKDEIRDEEKGHEHYERLAKKDSKNRALLTSFAKDEERHEKGLKRIEKLEHRAKTKALSTKKK